MTDNLTDGNLLSALDQIRNLKSERATLRDQFAMAALPGIIMNDTNIPEDASRYAYEMADAMLEARKEKK